MYYTRNEIEMQAERAFDMQETNMRLMENAPVSQAILKLSLPTVFSTIVSFMI